MHNFTLRLHEGHLFVNIEADDWLLDTGAPKSFGTKPIKIAGQEFSIPNSFEGLSATQLSELLGHPAAGVIGTDVLNKFDALIDVRNKRVSFSLEPIALDGEILEIVEFMGVPIVQANIGGVDRRMFLDTGAQISYFQDESLKTFPAMAMVTR